MAINTRANIPPAVRDYYDRLLLMTVYPQLNYTRFAQHRKIPEKDGDTAVFRRYNRLSTVPIPLSDGVTPPGALLDQNTIKARVSWYGNYVIFTDQVEMVVEDRILNESSRLLAENMGETIDELTRDVLAATSSVLGCANGSNGQTPTEMTKADTDAAVVTLLGNNAKMISEVMKGSNMFDTAIVRPAFMAFTHTDLIDDLEAVANFVSESNYSQQGKAMDGEWGATGNIRWFYSSIASKSAATPAVYDNIIVSREAYGVVHLGSEQGEFYVEPLGSAGAADPLHQRGSVGWKLPFVSRIFNDALLLNLQCTHS